MVYECPEDLNGREAEIVFRSGKNHYITPNSIKPI